MIPLRLAATRAPIDCSSSGRGDGGALSSVGGGDGAAFSGGDGCVGGGVGALSGGDGGVGIGTLVRTLSWRS